ncbi:scavenger receptor cysteine-rich domain-containing protein DMBT1-like [Diadema antillarum]|uniref:scavenger receptor cysteine-rich domain-containing protein DMBT1-like n=1 Tax=Diadema antillarum TaxID=105358 RepID=UPI003A8823EE
MPSALSQVLTSDKRPGLRPFFSINVQCTGDEDRLTDCDSNSWGDQTTAATPKTQESYALMKVIETSEGEIRLADGSKANKGRVEIYHGSQWGTICNYGWDSTEEEVTCRQLSYQGVSDSYANSQDGDGPIHLVLPRLAGGPRRSSQTALALATSVCSGYESQLSSCVWDSEWNINTCDHSQDVGVECGYEATQQGAGGYPTQPTATNMAPPPSYTAVVYAAGSSGVQVPHMTQYAPYPSAVQQNTMMAPQASATTVPTVVDANSKGAVPIQNAAAQLENTVRLVGGTNIFEGRVEILRGSQWGTVCDDNWDLDDALVVCRQLGYGDAIAAKTNAYFGRGGDSQPILMDGVACSGSERMLADCYFFGWGNHDCRHSEDAGVICSYAEDGAVRLVDGSGGHEGRVEIFHDSEWGTVCDDSWDMTDANVVCRQLGYESALSSETVAYFGRGRNDQTIFLDDVNCYGYEEELSECSSNGWGNHDCGHGEDAGVICRHDAEEGDLRLAGSSSPGRGRVEIYHNNEWGTVCDDGWGQDEAEVVCRQLGYEGVSHSSETFEAGTGPIHLDDVSCVGTESRLSYCSHREPWGSNNCQHSEDVGVRCNTYESAYEGDVRLVDGSSRDRGRVEIYHNSEWGTVCDDGWGGQEAEVVCRQLGFSSVVFAVQYFEQGRGPIHLDDVSCNGYEWSLSSCYHRPWGENNCDHSEDIGVHCSYAIDPPYEEGGMAGWLIGVIVVCSVFGFTIILTIIGTVCSASSQKRRRPSPTVFSVSGNPTPATDTAAARDGVGNYPRQDAPPYSAPPPSYAAVMSAPSSNGVEGPQRFLYGQPGSQPVAGPPVGGSGPTSNAATAPSIVTVSSPTSPKGNAP